MDITTPPSEKATNGKGRMDLYVQRQPTPPSDHRGPATPSIQPEYARPKTNHVSKSGWVAINAKPQADGQDEDYEDDNDYDMDIDKDNPSIDRDEYPDEDFEDDLEYYTRQSHEYQDEIAEEKQEEEQEEEEEEDEPSELDGPPHQILKIYGSHSHIILTATTKTSPLLTPHEQDLMTQIKSRKDEATLGFPSGSHTYHPYLGPSILRNASLERLGQFLNGPELEKIKIDPVRWPDRDGWRREKARLLWRMLYVRAIRDRETEGILREVEKQDKEREEVRVNGETVIGPRSSLFVGYDMQVVEEEEVSWDEMLKNELERKTEGLSPVERKEWMRSVYGARWTWYVVKFGLVVEMEEENVVVRS
ncbi:hypothetical protein FKW77_000938 [Venturia effusa]|uniref:Uncharacterized protein n=1 Tax=Venturia effusa TaxID=50376 RepID=A0A517LPG7_9PEZI|nr:hypothetical protein FKW77_000938 [Venturia effusa]